MEEFADARDLVAGVGDLAAVGDDGFADRLEFIHRDGALEATHPRAAFLLRPFLKGAVDAGIVRGAGMDPVEIRRSEFLEAPTEDGFIENPGPVGIVGRDREVSDVVRHGEIIDPRAPANLPVFWHPMSKERQSPFLIRSLHVRYDPGTELEPHAHAWAQLVYASEGVMTVRTSEGSWVVPPERALLVPAGVEHSIRMAGHVTMRTLYLEPQLVGDRLAGRPIVVNVSRLIREFILHIVACGMLQRGAAADERMAAVLVDLLEAVPVAPLELRTPTDSRALLAAERIRGEGADELSLDALAREVGASRRTLERLFQAETGMTLGRWRQLARLLRALEMLAAGTPVTQVALDVGYRSPSAFIQTFRNLFGTTPGRYFETEEAPEIRHDSAS